MQPRYYSLLLGAPRQTAGAAVGVVVAILVIATILLLT
jgi:tetrahydromethanopterin S-methyltransferase subunit F